MKQKKLLKFSALVLCIISCISSIALTYVEVLENALKYSNYYTMVPFIAISICSFIMLILCVTDKKAPLETSWNIGLSVFSLGALVYTISEITLLLEFQEPFSREMVARIIAFSIYFLNFYIPLFKIKSFTNYRKSVKAIGLIVLIAAIIFIICNDDQFSKVVGLIFLLQYIADWLNIESNHVKTEENT